MKISDIAVETTHLGYKTYKNQTGTDLEASFLKLALHYPEVLHTLPGEKSNQQSYSIAMTMDHNNSS